MTQTNIRIVALFHPSTTTEGKLYIAGLDARAPFAIHGPNRSSASGTLVDGKSLPEMQKTVADKQKKGYTIVEPSQLSSATRKHFEQELLKRLGMADGTPVAWARDGQSITINGGASAPHPSGAAKKKPILWNRNDVNVWI
jgi:hypothetical protein